MATGKLPLVFGSWIWMWACVLPGLLRASPASDPAFALSSDSLDYAYGDSYMSDWSKDWAMLSGRMHQPKCIDIPSNLTLCRGIGYTQMRLPNLLDHDTVREVVQQASSWRPLLGIQCHPDTRLFLCSLFSPVCLDRPIWPCRSLCNAVKTNCEGYMMKYGFPWPEMLRCEKFPFDNDLCIGQQSENNKDDRVCESCGKPVTFESIVHNYCDSDFALKLRLRENVIVAGNMKLVPQRKKKVLKKGSLKKRDVRRLELYIPDGFNCDCPPVANVTESTRDYFLVMGRMRGDKAELNYVSVYDRRNKDIRKAMRAIRKNQDICKSGLQAITGDSPQGEVEEGGQEVEGTVTTAPSEQPRTPEVEINQGRRREKGKKSKGKRKRERNLDRQGNRKNRRRNNNNNNNNNNNERNHHGNRRRNERKRRDRIAGSS